MLAVSQSMDGATFCCAFTIMIGLLIAPGWEGLWSAA